MASMISILLLGPPQILRDGAAAELPRRRTRALVYYLAAQPGPVAREQLLALLWPDHERAAAQQILRTTLHGARKLLGPALLASDETLAISQDADIDLRTLAAAVAAPDSDEGQLVAALARRRGELLEGFSLPDSEAFEGWLAAERERARLIAVRGLARLARLREARADYAGALDALSQALAFDPLQEDLQRNAMRLHYLSGDRVGAIRRYEQLRDLLDAEMGVPPMEETRALYDAVITDSLDEEARRQGAAGAPGPAPSLSPARRSPPPPLPQAQGGLPFIGRAVELERLRLATQSGRLALIEGAAGIGKTRLAEEFLAQHEGLTLVGAARELEQALPYQPLVSALRGLFARPDWPELRRGLALEPIWLAEAARLLPELAAGSAVPPAGNPDEARLWEGLARLLAALARQRPLALLLDDLQWADASTLGLVGYLLRRGQDAPLSLIATARPAAPRTPLAALIVALTREGRLERISLDALSSAEILALAQRLSPLFAQPLAQWLEQNAEGNPYIMAELVRHAHTSGILLEGGALNLSALSAAPVVPQTVYSLIESRLARLSDGARRVLDAAVAIGREFDFELAARAAALSEGAALDALDELRAARLVEPLPDGRFRFDHSLTMEVAYREVGEPRHRLLHRRVAEALEVLRRDRLDDVAGLIASHLAEGGEPGRAAAYALRAGRRATTLAAWSEAVGFYEQALPGLAPTERYEALLALGEAHNQAGEVARSVERFRAAIDLAPDPTATANAHLALARALLPQGRYHEMIALVRPLAESTDPAQAVAARFIWGTALSHEGADLEGAAAQLRQAEAILLGQGQAADPVSLAQVRFELGSLLAQQGDLVRAIAYYHEALAVADGAPDIAALDGAATWRILARNNLAYHLHLLGDLPAAERYAAEALAMAEERGAISLQPYLLSTSGEIALARGDLAAAEKHFTAGLALAERLVNPERVAGLSANLGLVAARRGQTGLAIHRLSTALGHADELGIQHLAALIRIWLAPLLPPAEARAALAHARAIAESGGRQRLLAEIAQAEAALATSG